MTLANQLKGSNRKPSLGGFRALGFPIANEQIFDESVVPLMLSSMLSVSSQEPVSEVKRSYFMIG